MLPLKQLHVQALGLQTALQYCFHLLSLKLRQQQRR
jgi:hypothetical protein